MAKTAFVTGGTGFIGLNLIESLVQSNWKVTVFHRQSSDLRRLKELPVQLRQGCITDKCSLSRATPDHTDVFFHLAGDTSLWSRNDLRQSKINVEGTRNAVQVAQKKKAKTFIYTSSASAWGDMSGKIITEQLPQLGYKSWVNYEKTKWTAEQEVLKGAGNSMKIVILNPTTVTGPYDRNNWGKLFFALRDNQLPGIPNGIVSVTHVREVVKAHLAAAETGRNGERYILSGEDIRISDFVCEIARVSGCKKIPVLIPGLFLKMVAYLQGAISSLSGKKPDLTPELVRIMTRQNVRYSSEKAANELGYKIIPMKQSVLDCYNWLRTEGLL